MYVYVDGKQLYILLTKSFKDYYKVKKSFLWDRFKLNHQYSNQGVITENRKRANGIVLQLCRMTD